MRMRLDTSVFTSVRKASIRVKPWKGKSPPPYTEDPLESIINLARYAGMRSIPRRTVLAFRYYPYFRYCFYALNHPVYERSFRGVREALIRLLKDPDSMTLEDICRGLECYLNNFTDSMPGGARGVLIKDKPRLPERKAPKLEAIDSVLNEMGMREMAEVMRAKVGENPNDYELKRDYLRLALVVFEKLVKAGFKREELWT